MRRRRQAKLFIDTFDLIDDCEQKTIAQDDLLLTDSMERGHDHLRDDLSRVKISLWDNIIIKHRLRFTARSFPSHQCCFIQNAFQSLHVS